MTRIKVTCNAKMPSYDNDGCYLVFTPVTTGSEENKEFFKYTPGGQIQLNICNPNVTEKFVLGEEYYCDFSPTREEEIV